MLRGRLPSLPCSNRPLALKASEATLHASGQTPRLSGILVQLKLLYAVAPTVHPTSIPSLGEPLLLARERAHIGREIEEELIDVIQVPCAGVQTPRHGPWVSKQGSHGLWLLSGSWMRRVVRVQILKAACVDNCMLDSLAAAFQIQDTLKGAGSYGLPGVRRTEGWPLNPRLGHRGLFVHPDGSLRIPSTVTGWHRGFGIDRPTRIAPPPWDSLLPPRPPSGRERCSPD